MQRSSALQTESMSKQSPWLMISYERYNKVSYEGEMHIRLDNTFMLTEPLSKYMKSSTKYTEITFHIITVLTLDH